MANNRRLIVEIIGDERSFTRALGRSSTAANRFQRDVEGVTVATTKLDKLSALKGLGAGLIASQAAQGIGQFVNAASGLNEQLSKSQVVFGDSSAAVKQWSETTARAFGISQRAALEASGTFGTIATAMGVPEQAAADLSRNLVNLAGDLASFNDVSTDDALLALRSAIVGEYEPLRRLGSVLSEARVQQQAMTETGKTSARELTNQEKILARYHLILQDTSKAQGDFARTSGSLANQQRALAAQADNLRASVGSSLLPVMTDFAEILNAGADAAQRLGDALGKIPTGGGGGGGLFGLDGLKASDLFVLPGVKLTADLLRATQPEKLPQITAGPDLGLGGDAFKGLRAGQFKIPANLVQGSPFQVQEAILDASLTPELSDDLKAMKDAAAQAKAALEKTKDGTQKHLDALREYTNAQQRVDLVEDEIASDRQRAAEEAKRTADASRAAARLAAEQAKNAAAAAYRDDLQVAEGRLEIAQIKADTPKEELAAQKRLIAFYRREARDPKLSVLERQDFATRLAQAVKDYSTAVSEAAAKQADALKKSAADFKSRVLDALDREQKREDVSRSVRDAKESLRLAKVIGGPIGIRNAREELADAERARKRFILEGATFTARPGGGFNVQTTGDTYNFTITGVTNGKELFREFKQQMQRSGKRRAPQSSGRNPGGIYGLPH